MASNHVLHPDQNLQNGPVFTAEGHEGYGYNHMYSHSQPYPNNLLVDQQRHHLNGAPGNSPYNTAPAFSPPAGATAWQNTATPSSQPTPVQASPYSTTNHEYYGMRSSSAQASYPNATLPSGHGLAYAQAYDSQPSRQGEPRLFDQSIGRFSSGSPQSNATIAPSSLHSAPTLNRQIPAPGAAMQTIFSARQMPDQSQVSTQPQVLNQSRVSQIPNQSHTHVAEPATSQNTKMPKGTASGNFVIITFEDLAKITQSSRLHNFVNLGQIPLDLPYNKASAVPNYVPRKSINDLKALAAKDLALRSESILGALPTSAYITPAKITKVQKKNKFHLPKSARLKDAPQPGVLIDVSSTSDSSESDSDDSSYQSDSPEPEPSPIPGQRPQKAIEIVRYDTIKAVWLPRNKFAENEKILKGMGDLWEVVRTIRDRWKADREAVKKATETKKASELPLLKERVEKQLEMMEEVLKASVAYGHPDLLSAYVYSIPPEARLCIEEIYDIVEASLLKTPWPLSHLWDFGFRYVRHSHRKAFDVVQCPIWTYLVHRAGYDSWTSLKNARTFNSSHAMMPLRICKLCYHNDYAISNLHTMHSIIRTAEYPKVKNQLANCDDSCGQNGALMAVCYQFLLEPIRENDYSGSFTKAAFKFLTTCTNLNGDVADKSNLSKILSRASKRGTEEVKVLTKKIEENIAAQNKKPKSSSLKTEVKTIKSELDSTAGIKRPRSAEPASGQAAKRVASGNKVLGRTESVASKLGLIKKPTTSTTAPSATTTKPKVVAKPATNFFAGLQSASKRPGTNNPTIATKPKTGVIASGDKKGPASAAPTTMPRPAFSFAETMANLSKEREQAPVKKEEDRRPPETTEEKARRLRKEERRRLRVSWKPDAALVEIRTFSRDPSEIPGRSSNVRDVRDGKEKEGLMFKQHMEMMDMDVDEDDDTPMEQSFFEFTEPLDVDFSGVPQSERDRNFERFGGLLQVDSPERNVQENHEMTTLMVHYLVKSDIPACPKEPVDPHSGPQADSKGFGYPDGSHPWLLDRLSKSAPTSVAAAPHTDISALLQAIGAANPQPIQAPPQTIPDISAIQNIVAQFTGTQTVPPAAAPQQTFTWPHVSQSVAATDTNPAMNKPLEAILAELSGAPVPAPASPAAPPTAAPPLGDVSALLAMLQNNATAGIAPVVNPYQGYEGYVTPANDSQESQRNLYGSSSSATGQHNDNDANGAMDQEWDRNGQKRKWQGNPTKKFLFPCRFWKEGKCKKGAACTFKHE